MSIDPKTFGLQMKALRGTMTQPVAAELSGVRQDRISKLESGLVNTPSFEMIARLCRVYNVSPADVAAMVGLWTPPDPDEDESLTRDARRVLGTLQNMLSQMDEDRQEEFAALLSGVIRIEQMEEIKRQQQPSDDSILPAFLRRSRRQT